MRAKESPLAQQWLQNRDTEAYQYRAEHGKKTAEDFAGEFLYHMPAGKRFEEYRKEHAELGEDMLDEILDLVYENMTLPFRKKTKS